MAETFHHVPPGVNTPFSARSSRKTSGRRKGDIHRDDRAEQPLELWNFPRRRGQSLEVPFLPPPVRFLTRLDRLSPRLFGQKTKLWIFGEFFIVNRRRLHRASSIITVAAPEPVSAVIGTTARSACRRRSGRRLRAGRRSMVFPIAVRS
jgi:hypothetical protein